MLSRCRKGYTLAEVAVVITIFVAVSAVVLANYREASRREQLRAAAEQVAAAIRLAKAKAYSNAAQEICVADGRVCRSGSACDAAYPTGCSSQAVTHYGIKFNTDGNRTEYAIGADSNAVPDLQYDPRDIIPGGRLKLPTGFRFVSDWSSSSAWSIWFVYDQYEWYPFGSHGLPAIKVAIEDARSGQQLIVELVTWSDTIHITSP